MTIKAKEFDRLVEKFDLRTRDSADLLAWFAHEGKVVVRTRRSKGSGDLPMQHSIRQQLHLTESEMRRAIDCTMTRNDCVALLSSKGYIKP